MMKVIYRLVINLLTSLSLLIFSSCTNSSIATSEIKSPLPTFTPSSTPSPSITPTVSITQTASITPAIIVTSEIHPLALNENNISKIKNLSTFGTSSKYCLVSPNLDSSINTRFSNGQTEYLLASKDRDESRIIHIWNLTTKQAIQTFNEDNIANTVLFTPDHNTLVSFSRYEPGMLILWDIQSGSQRQKFVFKPYYFYDGRISLSPDGLRIALFSGPYNSKYWQVSEFNLQTNQINDSDYDFPLYRENLLHTSTRQKEIWL